MSSGITIVCREVHRQTGAVPDDFFCALAERKDGDSNVHSDQRPEKRY